MGVESIYKKLLKDKMITDNVIFEKEEQQFLSSGIIKLNVAMSGKIDGMVPCGKITLNSAHSMLGKTLIGLNLVADSQKKDFFPVVLDTEYAWDKELAIKFGIDVSPERLYVYQENRIEKVQEKIMSIVEGMPIEDRKKVFFMFDSWGSLVTNEDVVKSQDADSKRGMTETLKKNRMALMMTNSRATFYVINHVYQNVGGFGDALKIPGGSKIIYQAQNVVLGTSRAKDEKTIKGEDVLTGSLVSCKIYKTRYAKELIKFHFRIKYEGGLDTFYGILEDAVDGGFVTHMPSGRYTRAHIKDDKQVYEKDLYTENFWIPIFKDTKFREYLENLHKNTGDMDSKNSEFFNSIDEESEADVKAEAEIEKASN